MRPPAALHLVSILIGWGLEAAAFHAGPRDYTGRPAIPQVRGGHIYMPPTEAHRTICSGGGGTGRPGHHEGFTAWRCPVPKRH
jgi:hypothetical protein